MFGTHRKLKDVYDRLETLEGQLDLLRLEWKDWRKQLVKAAARLEKAASREEAKENGGETTVETEAQRINRQILERRRSRGIPHGTG